jgi:hypothetical protein
MWFDLDHSGAILYSINDNLKFFKKEQTTRTGDDTMWGQMRWINEGGLYIKTYRKEKWVEKQGGTRGGRHGWRLAGAGGQDGSFDSSGK